MPVQRCTKNGKEGWKAWAEGPCFIGGNARARAERQLRAIEARKAAANKAVVNQRRTARNPSRTDPSKTGRIRRRFIADVRRRYRRIQQKIVDLVVKENAFGIGVEGRTPADLAAIAGNAPAANTRWALQSNAQKAEAFRRWLEAELIAEGLPVAGSEFAADAAFWTEYTAQGYDKGMNRAFRDTRKEALQSPEFFRGSQAEFMQAAFSSPVAASQVELLAGRVFTELKGIDDEMDRRITRALTDGLVEGQNPRTIARTMVEEVDITRKRAETIARTEIMRSHSEGQLDALEQLGVTEIGVRVEWETSGLGETALGNPSPCPICAPLEGVVLSVQEARGLLPRHPNCLCTFKPANVGEDTSGQKRTRRDIERARNRSVKAEGKGTLASRKRKSDWPGARRRVSPRRRRTRT